MMETEGTGKDGAITKNDVINIFEENRWVLYGFDGKGDKKKDQGWFFSGKFDDMLVEFNRRRDLLRNEGLDRFINKEYDTVYERFYRNLPDGTADADGFYSLVAPRPWFGDYAMWIDHFAGFWTPNF
jgi:hypothetical protein